MPKRGRDQLDLFGAGPPKTPEKQPDFEPPAATTELARTLDPLIHLGTSSWTFPGWAGLCWSAPDWRQIPDCARVAQKQLTPRAGGRV